MTIHQRRCGGEDRHRRPVPVFLRRRKVKIQPQHIPLFLHHQLLQLRRSTSSTRRGRGRQRSVSSHMAAERLPGGEFRSTNRTLVNLRLDDVTGGWPAGGQLQGEMDGIGGCKLGVLLLNRIGNFGLFMASSMSTQGLKRRKTTIASFALINKQRFISNQFLLNQNRAAAAPCSSLRQKNQTIGQILIFFFFLCKSRRRARTISTRTWRNRGRPRAFGALALDDLGLIFIWGFSHWRKKSVKSGKSGMLIEWLILKKDEDWKLYIERGKKKKMQCK